MEAGRQKGSPFHSLPKWMDPDCSESRDCTFNVCRRPQFNLEAREGLCLSP